MVAIYWILAESPLWATAIILYFSTLGVIHVGRDYFEGMPYQVSYSAAFGDVLLFGAVLISATILKREGVTIPSWFQFEDVHWLILAVCFAIGISVSINTSDIRSGQQMDTYHDVIIGPMILYFAITLIPIIALNGTRIEIFATIGFVLIWALLVVFDIKYERMDQRVWLKRLGVVFKN
jgi:hypothetical protein